MALIAVRSIFRPAGAAGDFGPADAARRPLARLHRPLRRPHHHRLAALRGTGGLIAVDRLGNYTMSFNTSGMYRGVVDGRGKFEVKIYKNR